MPFVGQPYHRAILHHHHGIASYYFASNKNTGPNQHI